MAVKDLEASGRFYEKFGFKAFAGDAAQNWLLLKDGDHVIGLFQGMFEKNILTFNPGWDQNAQKLASFTDIRDLQRQLKAQGVQLPRRRRGAGEGYASHAMGSEPRDREKFARYRRPPTAHRRETSSRGARLPTRATAARLVLIEPRRSAMAALRRRRRGCRHLHRRCCRCSPAD
ncbi:uncharacterized protein SOCE26_029930 [Sorangium cellulosum]|uniref:Glyoxalase n=1 Tax=Sorangium cellulosum TaxID=56 RepID=A0A2L0EQN9_SORCE|nr:uncharacterized protein SOCE26_029930 [Sorangium cellulosum]